jgi:FAD/FMN-containing dehydrogenase
MLDLSRVRSVHVDPVARCVRVEGGVLLGDVDKETQAVGLTVRVKSIPRQALRSQVGRRFRMDEPQTWPEH